MNTKEWGVLSFLVGISMAGLFQEIPSSMFVLVVVPVFCTIIGYSAWRNSINLTQTISTNPQSAGKQSCGTKLSKKFLNSYPRTIEPVHSTRAQTVILALEFLAPLDSRPYRNTLSIGLAIIVSLGL